AARRRGRLSSEPRRLRLSKAVTDQPGWRSARPMQRFAPTNPLPPVTSTWCGTSPTLAHRVTIGLTSPRTVALRGRLDPALAPALGLLASLLTWPVFTMVPGSDLDWSWQIGLHLAYAQGLDYGRDIVFTYGPLGFLQFPLLVSRFAARASFAWTFASHTALVA